jgi:Ca2+-binding EF-hand superfamily protein
MKLPTLVGERFFAAVDNDRDSMLSKSEFLDAFRLLYKGVINEIMKIIFAMYDFDSDGTINVEDSKKLLKYIPIEEFGWSINK